MSLDPREILIAPVVSEKSYSLIEDNKYSFRVHSKAHAHNRPDGAAENGVEC